MDYFVYCHHSSPSPRLIAHQFAIVAVVLIPIAVVVISPIRGGATLATIEFDTNAERRRKGFTVNE